MKIARVFPRITKATPDDELAFFGYPKPGLEVDEVHVSVTFTYDKPQGEYLAGLWSKAGYDVKIGGPAYEDKTDFFIPGMYLKKGYVITSVGCNNNCWFCRVPKTQGPLREMPLVMDGWNVLDDNLLSCSEAHIKYVFSMLKRQPERPKFTGGLEAKLLKPWHVELLKEVKVYEMFFAYDTPDDYEHLVNAGKLLAEYGFKIKSKKQYCYVLIGYPNDTFDRAEKRLIDTLKAGFIPFAMLYKDESGFEDPEWAKFQRLWIRPAIIYSRNKEFFK